MSRDSGPVRPLEQRCVEPGRWIIEGRHVRAAYQGRSRNVLCWDILIPMPGDPETPLGGFRTLAEVRDWIRDLIEAGL